MNKTERFALREDVPRVCISASFQDCVNSRFLKDKKFPAHAQHNGCFLTHIGPLLPKDVFSFCNCFSLKRGKLFQMCSVSCNLDNKFYPGPGDKGHRTDISKIS